jgi:hypothetical protein
MHKEIKLNSGDIWDLNRLLEVVLPPKADKMRNHLNGVKHLSQTVF